MPLEDVEGVRVRSLTELERSQNERFVLDQETGRVDPDRAEMQTAHLLWLSLVDGDGNQCYSHEQIPALANLPEAVTTPILRAIEEMRTGGAKKNGSAKTPQG